MAHTNFKGPVWSSAGFGVGVGHRDDGDSDADDVQPLAIDADGNIAAPSVTVGATGTPITLVQRGTTSVVVAAIAAGAQADVSQTIASAVVGDTVIINPNNSAMETGLAILAAWVSANGTVKIRLGNVKASGSLTGSTSNWNYELMRS